MGLAWRLERYVEDGVGLISSWDLGISRNPMPSPSPLPKNPYLPPLHPLQPPDRRPQQIQPLIHLRRLGQSVLDPVTQIRVAELHGAEPGFVGLDLGCVGGELFV